MEFDLQAALNGAKVHTRSGSRVEDLHYFKTANDKQRLYGVLIYDGQRLGEVMQWNDDGSYLHDGTESGNDLILIV